MTGHSDDHDDCGRHGASAMSRRAFLKSASAGAIAIMGSSAGLPDISLAAGPTKTLIKIFMRGGADPLSLFPLTGDDSYYTYRPRIAVARPSSADSNAAIRLTDAYGLNPNLAALMEIWDSGRMAISPATHFTEGNRSHFDCQTWIEIGSTDRNLQGVFNRYLREVPNGNLLRAVRAGSTSLSQSMRGPVPVPSIASAADYKLTNSDWCKGAGCSENVLMQTLLGISGHATGTEIEKKTRAITEALFKPVDVVQAANASYVPALGGINYYDGLSGRSVTTMGRGLRLVAQLLKAGVPVEVAALDWSGSWDTHEKQVGTSVIDQTNGHAASLASGATDLVAFWRDIADLRDNVLVMIGSEFGRTVHENGTTGTDHGNGAAWFCFGGPTRGGIYNGMTTVEASRLLSGRYIPVLTNYKDILGEAMVRHLGVSESIMSRIIPGHAFTNHGMFSASV